MKCLVTGANGFIGNYLVDILKKKEIKPLLLLRKNSFFENQKKIICDLSFEKINPDNLSDIDTVFHLASCQDTGNTTRMYKVNVDGTKRLIQACEEAGVKNFIFFSSVKAMGETTIDESNESYLPAPESEYGRQKLIAEEIVLKSHLSNPVILRLPPVYGRGCKGGIINLVKFIKKSPLIPFLNINNKRSMLYVNDAVYFAISAANSHNVSRECFILTDGLIYSTNEVFRTILDVIDKEQKKLLIKNFVTDYFIKNFFRVFWIKGYNALYESAYYSNKKALQKLNFHPTCTFYQAAPEICQNI